MGYLGWSRPNSWANLENPWRTIPTAYVREAKRFKAEKLEKKAFSFEVGWVEKLRTETDIPKLLLSFISPTL